MVWGCFSRLGLGQSLILIQRDTIPPFAEEDMPLRLIFQQDNDPKHSSKIVKYWFRQKNITVLKCPSLGGLGSSY